MIIAVFFILLVILNIGLFGWIIWQKKKHEYDIKNNIDGIMDAAKENKDMRGIKEFISDSNKKDKDNLAELVRMMKESKDDENREKRDKELIDYVKNRNMSPGSIAINTGRNGTLIEKSGGDLIPLNLNEKEKELLRQFYNS